MKQRKITVFFIGIFGIEEKEKEIKDFSNVICPNCGRLARAVLYMQYTCFHFFFIPLFKWNRRYYLKLRCCDAVYEAPSDYVQELKDSSFVDFTRMQKVSGGFGGTYDDFFKTCAFCGKTFDKSFSYCPHCGKHV
jgi:hypothetical protein